MAEDWDALGSYLQEIVTSIKSDTNIDELDRFRKEFRKNVSFWMRSYVAAYLIRQNTKGQLRMPGKPAPPRPQNNMASSPAPSAPPTTSRDLKEPVSLFFGAGRSRRAGPRDVVSTLMQTGLVAKEEIGDIKILENYSFVDVERSKADALIASLESATHRGRPLKVNYAKKNEDAPPEIAAE